MTSSAEQNQSKPKIFPATIARIITPTRIVINRGSEHGVKKGQKMLVYSLEENEIKDPNTGESLGHLEVYKGTGKIIHIQEKMSIIESDRNKYTEELSKALSTIISFPASRPFPSQEIRNENIPFENPQVGDLVKPI
ncbi:MAG: hypothetical protein AAGE84_11500 [Cyanobacteria bacterium P01_G01_bin.39]